MFRNAQRFNQKGSLVFTAAQRLDKVYAALKKELFDGDERPITSSTVFKPTSDQMRGFPEQNPATGELAVGLDAGCCICKQDTEAAKMLICDRCDHEFHQFCLHPPLRKVPAGDFWCPRCLCVHGSDLLGTSTQYMNACVGIGDAVPRLNGSVSPLASCSGRRVDIKVTGPFAYEWRTGTIVRVVVRVLRSVVF